MGYATTEDGVRLYFEETGSGTPVIFVHEFAGDLRSWEPQLRHFGKRYRCIAYNARGFPPSDVPEDVGAYSQARAADDISAVLDAAGESKRSEEHTSELQSRQYLVCRLLLEKKKQTQGTFIFHS